MLMMRPVEASAAQISVESHVSDDKFDTLINRLDLVPKRSLYEKGAEIYGEESSTDYVYQVTSGAVRNYKLLSDGRCQITAFYLPGDIFGFDRGTRRQTTTDAITTTTIRAVKRGDIEAAAAEDLQLTRLLLSMAIEELDHARQQIVLLGRKTAIERVAAFLLEMERRLPASNILALPMSRRDMGDYLGLTLETVSRAFSRFHDQGILDFLDARHIALKNRARLRGMEN
jgi:CRP/FNR family transcriptional regulator, nitrogen fixation regulation protein